MEGGRGWKQEDGTLSVEVRCQTERWEAELRKAVAHSD